MKYAQDDPLRDWAEGWLERNQQFAEISIPNLVFQYEGAHDTSKRQDREFSKHLANVLLQLGWTRVPERKRGKLTNGAPHDKATFFKRP